MMRFSNRDDAGRQLAAVLDRADLIDPIVLGLPRGGVPVAAQVAAALGAPLEVFVARKIGAPGHEELGIGAIAEGSDDLVVTGTARVLGIDGGRIEALAARERAELDRRVQRYRRGRPLPSFEGRDVVLVDDGLATGVTAEAALLALRRTRPRRLVLAVPVCAPDTGQRLSALVDVLVCVATPPDFGAVGTWYDDFSQMTDDDVTRILGEHQVPGGTDARPRGTHPT
jgi:putative phosphoribosyl transferase